MNNSDRRFIRSLSASILLLSAVLSLLIFHAPVWAEEEEDSAPLPDVPGYSQTIYGYTYTGVAQVVVIPSSITEVNNYMFYKNKSVRGVIVPASVTYVAEHAFSRCDNLRYIWFMSSSVSVSDYFIDDLPSLINISAPKDSDIYSRCVRERIPVTSSLQPCFEKKTVYLLPKDTVKMPLFNSQNAVYSSGNKKIVTVKKDGTIRAKKKGKTVITATYDSQTYTYKVVVYDKTQKNRVRQIRKSEKLSSGKLSSVEKIQSVHDWLVRNVRYDYDNMLKGKVPGSEHTSKGSLIRKLCVCDGYAYGFQKVMKSIHIPCKVVRGKVDSVTHAWNMVCVGGKWYHVDVTFDDPIIDGSNTNTVPMYKYFLKSTSYMKDHGYKFKEAKYPKCTSKKYDKKGLSGYRNTLGETVYSW